MTIPFYRNFCLLIGMKNVDIVFFDMAFMVETVVIIAKPSFFYEKPILLLASGIMTTNCRQRSKRMILFVGSPLALTVMYLLWRARELSSMFLPRTKKCISLNDTRKMPLRDLSLYSHYHLSKVISSVQLRFKQVLNLGDTLNVSRVLLKKLFSQQYRPLKKTVITWTWKFI